MSERYDPSEVEPKWQAYWEREGTFRTDDDESKPKRYVLDMFPYPSGSGLHVGHPEGYTASDIVSRYLRCKGYAVLHPMGFDAFGLPAEQHAIKTGTHPAETTARNVDTFRVQLKRLGFSYDWSREVDTTDPAYVKWTQWIFLKLFERGLAYQAKTPVNWCAALGTVLANEEVIDGLSERGQHPVERLPLRQWVLRITAYADRLLAGLDDVEWPTSTMTMQREWIGRSVGAEVWFGVEDSGATGSDSAAPEHHRIEVFTTRPDTLFGATFMVLAPEHPLVPKVTTDAQRGEVEAYVAKAKSKSQRERQRSKGKTGVFTGGFARNPVNDERTPIWIADYVLMGYGTGAIMAVPAHDARDFEFATQFGIPIVPVVSDDGTPSAEPPRAARPEPGIAINSGKYDGTPTAELKERITADLEAAGTGKKRIEYKLRDWIFSRQRYWGEPIPIYFPVTTDGDPRAGAEHTIHYETPIAVDHSELPLRLPALENYQPGDDPAGVLARAHDWRFFQKDGQWFARETNTMPQWAGSCWYYLRFMDPHNAEEGWSLAAAKRWLPVDLYVGGAEHAVLHLLYARFWHMVLYDEGLVGDVTEPFRKLVHQGMILGEIEYTAYRRDGALVSADEVNAREGGLYVDSTGAEVTPERVDPANVAKGPTFEGVRVDARAPKMSKSRGNVVNPDDIIDRFGADSLRLYEMFMGPLEATKPWNTDSIQGVRRFLDRLFNVATRTPSEEPPGEALLRLTHKTIAKVSADIESLRLNTAIAAMMVLNNELNGLDAPPRFSVETLVTLVHPFAPHVAEELWERLGRAPSIQAQPWPEHDPALIVDAVVEVPVQINGKVRGRITLPSDADEATAVAAVEADEALAKQLEGRSVVKRIWVPGRILTIVVR